MIFEQIAATPNETTILPNFNSVTKEIKTCVVCLEVDVSALTTEIPGITEFVSSLDILVQNVRFNIPAKYGMHGTLPESFASFIKPKRGNFACYIPFIRPDKPGISITVQHDHDIGIVVNISQVYIPYVSNLTICYHIS